MNTKTDDRPADVQDRATQGGSLPANTKPKHPLVDFKEFADQRMAQLAYALPPHISPDRFTRVLLTSLQRNPSLLNCTKPSLWNACLLAAQDGLLPDGREGAIAPYGVNDAGKRVAEIATWMPMIEGLRKKARNSGEILNWEAHVVHALDLFEVVLGDTPRINHKPYIGPDEPGGVIAAYSIAWLKDGAISREIMTKRQLDEVRAKSKAAKGPWSDPAFVPEMYRKTVARRHYKQLPHSSDLDAIMARDDEAFGLNERSVEAVTNRQTRRIASTEAAFDQFAGADDGEKVIDGEKPEYVQDGSTDASELGDFDEQNNGPPHPVTPQTTATQPAPVSGGETTGQPPAWPAEKVPKTSEEYEQYVTWKVTTFENGADLEAWFKGEAKLRNSCGVLRDDYEKVRLIRMKRVEELNAAAKKA